MPADDIARLYNFIAGTTIASAQANAELNQLINTMNSKLGRSVDNTLTGANTHTGLNTFTNTATFSGAIKADVINENTPGNGVFLNSMRVSNGYANIASVRAVVSSIDTATDIITTTTAHNFTTGDTLRVRNVGGGLPSGLSATTTYFARNLTTTTFTLHPTSTDATNNTNRVDITTVGTGTQHLIAAPSSPSNYDLWIDDGGVKARIGGATQTLVASASIPPTTLFNNTAAPLYLTSNTFSVARILCRDSADTLNIVKNTSTTVDKSTTGLNGIAQSANLTGTVTVSASGTTVTGTSTTFTTDFVVGDVIRTNGGQARRITAVTNNTSMTVTPAWTSAENTVAYRNGGDAPSTFYNLYAITDGTTPGLILSTRNVAGGQSLVNLPTGYTSTRQLPFCTTNNASSSIIPFRIGAGWPSRPKILYNVQMTMFDGSAYTAGTTNVLNAGTAGTFTAISLSAFQPTISTVSLIATYAQGANAGQWNVRPTGESHLGMPVAEDGNQTAAVNPSIFLTYQQSLDYRRAFGSGSLYIDVFGFVVTEVA